ncbi:MAG: hypothetical protein PHS37_10195 [Candidatus Omnitrophica bacterium]|nr:hypothetical protein [Candidatus Omnitrophota bacterium]
MTIIEIEPQKDPLLDLLKIIITVALVLMVGVLLVWHGIFGVALCKAAKKARVNDIIKTEVNEKSRSNYRR